jgi:hypothetical protein
VAKVGKILKSVKDGANAFDVTFPTDATSEQKALLVGTSIFLNANFFELSNGNYCFRGFGVGLLVGCFAATSSS